MLLPPNLQWEGIHLDRLVVVDWTGDYTSGVTFYAPSHFSGAIQYIRITISLLHAGSTVFVSCCICAMLR